MKQKLCTFLQAILLITCLSITACSMHKNWTPQELFQGDYQLKDLRTGFDADDSQSDIDACRNFSLTEQQVRNYFKNAKIISREAWHYEYLWSPCYVRGTLIKKGRAYNWEISTTQLGWIKDKKGKDFILACDDCGPPFIDGHDCHEEPCL